MGGIRVLIGSYDGEEVAKSAVMVDDTSGFAFGPLFSSNVDPADHVESFLGWVASGAWVEHRATIFPSPDNIYRVAGRLDGTDPREFTERGVERLVTYWRAAFLGPDGELLIASACATCGHDHNIEEDGTVGPCWQTLPATPGQPGDGPEPCPCTAATWKPANALGENLPVA